MKSLSRCAKVPGRNMSQIHRAPSISSDPPIIEQLKKEKAQVEREVHRLQRELELVKGRSEGKIQSLEESVERQTLAVGQLQAELDRAVELNKKLASELSILQDNVIDQQNEISSLQTRQRLMDAELARKDRDAGQLLAAARRYKSRVEYLKARLKRTTVRRGGNNKGSDEDEVNASISLTGASFNASVGDESPFNSVLGGSVVTGTSSVPAGGERRDSIQFPGYMTAEEEYFRLVVLAAKLNISGTSTPTTMDDHESLTIENDSMISPEEEQNDPEIDPSFMYAKIQADRIPFHKWHEWAQDYLIARRMPVLMGVDASSFYIERKQRKQGFARRVVSKAISRIKELGRKNKRKSIGVAAGGDGVDFSS
jgi:hypothetical protein